MQPAGILTQRLEMIGSPLAHVRTPALLNAMLAAQGDERRMLPKEVDRARLPAYVEALRRAGDVRGLVVTTPLKEAVCAVLDRRTPLVELIGSCNCVRIDRHGWLGGNFDGIGFAQAVRKAGLGLRGKRILLKGCGGAGKAIAARIAAEGARALVIDDPETARVAAFIARLGPQANGCEISAGSGDDGAFDLLVNASPLGMAADDPSPASAELVGRCAAVVDIVIAPGESRLGRMARELGKTLVGGAAMVEAQAAFLLGFILGKAVAEEATAESLP